MYKRRTKESDPTFVIFQGITSIIFVLFIFFVALHIGVSNKGIKILVHKYVDAVQLDDTYFDNYIAAGFTNEQCYELLSGQEIKDCVAKVMYEQVSALFANSSTYTYDKETCYTEVKDIIFSYVSKNNIKLASENSVDSLTNYTLDISGISAMYFYDSPAAYRQSIYSKESSAINDITDSFAVIAVLSSPVFIVTISVFLFICILIMAFIGTTKDTIWKIFNTFAYPALFIVGISLGYLFGASNNNILSRYVFSLFLMSSVLGLTISGVMLFTLHCCKRGPDNWFDLWLNKTKERHSYNQKYKKNIKTRGNKNGEKTDPQQL